MQDLINKCSKISLFNFFSRWLLAGVLLLSFTGCDIVSSVFESGNDGFGTTAGPVLYVASKNKPYSSYHKKQLYSMDKNGENTQKLTNYENFEVINAKWSPDGNRIVLVKNKLTSIGLGQNLYLVNHKGKNERKLIKTDNDKWNIRSMLDPVWSPDSRKIAFVGYTNKESGGDFDVYIINIETGRINKITNTPDVRETLGNWPQSDKIYAGELYLNTSPMRTQLIVLNESGKTVKAWGGYSNAYTYPMLSHNGKYLAFMKGGIDANSPSSGEDSESLKKQRVKVGTVGEEPDSATTVTKGSFKSYRPVQWLPDDKELLVMGISINENRKQEEAPYRYHIFRISRDGSDMRQITPGKKNFFYKPVSWIDPAKIGS